MDIVNSVDIINNNYFYKSLIVLGLILSLFIACNMAFTDNTQESFNTLQKNVGYSYGGVIGEDKLSISNNDNSESNVINKANAATKTSSSSKAKLRPIGSSKSVSQSSVLSASKNVKKYTAKNKKLPNSVTIEGYKYSMPEFTYLMSKTVEYKNKKINSRVTVKYNVKNPSKPSGTTVKGKFSSAKYYNYALKTSKYINKYNKVPNYITATKKVKIPYQTAVYMFSSILDYTNAKKKLPKYVSLKISSSNKLNKYVPKYVRSSSSKSLNNNAIWIQTKDFNNVNFAKLAKYGIGNIFLHEATISQYGKSKVINWAKTAANNGIKTHLWVQCFYSDGKWINPVVTNTKSYNTLQFNKILAKIKSYSQMDYIGGIHLDYLRYPGTAYKYQYSNGVSGEKAITKLVNKAKAYINKYNSNMILSAAVMPETSSNAYYYGQNIPQMGKYLDVIIPMIYKGNYGQNPNWIKSTSSWFSKNSGKAQVWSGLQTYVSDNNPTALSPSALKIDCLAALNGEADGLALFRWGLTAFFDFLTLY